MKIYLAGPMRGYPEYNFPEFLKQARVLREMGHEVLSPAEMDLADDPDTTKISEEVATANMRRYMIRDLAAVLECEAVALLTGWQVSTGALTESLVGRMYNCQLLDAYTLEPISPYEHTRALANKLEG